MELGQIKDVEKMAAGLKSLLAQRDRQVLDGYVCGLMPFV